MTTTLAIVGASLAGAKAAEAARSAGFDGSILLIGDEAHAPYERPALSKEVLRGDADPDTALVHPAGFYADQGIELVVDTVTAVDTDAKTLRLASKETIGYTSVVFATGARPRRLRLPGADLGGVHYLRTMDDAAVLHRAIADGAAVVVVGSGWIGSEVAASARSMGAAVTLVDPSPTPLNALLGDDVGSVFAGLHAEHGVDLRLGVGAQALQGTSVVEAVELSDGSRVAADAVVVGIGVVPNVEVAEAAGVPVADGITVDEYLRSPVEDVYAAGDVASAWHPFYRRHLRTEHWANALNQGAAAGHNAVARPEPYDALPYFFSDQYDLGLEYVGHHGAGDELVVRGDLARREFIAFWHHGGIVTAAMNVNVWDVVDDMRSLVLARRPVDLDRLGDPAGPLGSEELRRELGQG